MIHQLRMLSLKPFVADDGSMKICKLLLYVRVLRPVIPVVLQLKHPIKLTTRQKKKKVMLLHLASSGLQKCESARGTTLLSHAEQKKHF